VVIKRVNLQFVIGKKLLNNNYFIILGRIQINKVACNKAMRGEGKRGGNGKFVAYHI